MTTGYTIVKDWNTDHKLLAVMPNGDYVIRYKKEKNFEAILLGNETNDQHQICPKYANRLLVTTDGKKIIVIPCFGALYFYDVETMAAQENLNPIPENLKAKPGVRPITKMLIPNTHKLLYSNRNKTHILDLDTETTSELEHVRLLSYVDISVSNKLATAGYGKIVIYDLESQKEVSRFVDMGSDGRKTGYINKPSDFLFIRFSADGKKIITRATASNTRLLSDWTTKYYFHLYDCSQDGKITLVKLLGAKDEQGEQYILNRADFFLDGQKIIFSTHWGDGYSMSEKYHVGIIDIDSGKLLAIWETTGEYLLDAQRKNAYFVRQVATDRHVLCKLALTPADI